MLAIDWLMLLLWFWQLVLLVCIDEKQGYIVLPASLAADSQEDNAKHIHPATRLSLEACTS